MKKQKQKPKPEKQKPEKLKLEKLEIQKHDFKLGFGTKTFLAVGLTGIAIIIALFLANALFITLLNRYILPGAANVQVWLLVSILYVSVFLINTLYSSLTLWITAKLFKLPSTRLMTAFFTAFAAGVAYVVIATVIQLAIGGATFAQKGLLAPGQLGMALRFALVLVINSIAAKTFYKLETGKALLVGIAWTAAAIVTSIIIQVILTLMWQQYCSSFWLISSEGLKAYCAVIFQ